MRRLNFPLVAIACLIAIALPFILPNKTASVNESLAPIVERFGVGSAIASTPAGQLTSNDIQYQVSIALIKTVAWAETGFDSTRIGDDAYVDQIYRTAYTNVLFDSYEVHPFADESVPLPCSTVNGSRLCSGASGAFQFMPKTWAGLYARYDYWPVGPNGETFIPAAQDLALLRYYAETGAYWHLEKGTKTLGNKITVDDAAIAASFAKAAAKWCGLPGRVRGACAGQPQKSLYDAIAVFKNNLALQQGAVVPPYLVGVLGSTGNSSGPHAHIQDQSGEPLTLERVNKYFRFGGKAAEASAITSDEAAHRARGSRGIDIAYALGTYITGIGVNSVSPLYYDDRTGNYTIITFENGFEALVAHQLEIES